MNKNLFLSQQLRTKQKEFRAFVNEYIAPKAYMIDHDQNLSIEVINEIKNKGFWGTEISKDYGGPNFDMKTYGLLSEEMGRGCSNVRNLLGVQGMVSVAISKW